MTSIVPKLDDTDFDRLVEDGRGLIPRYAPEWTDHNLHDPGITLIDLIAWMVDRQVYRIGFVGDRLQRAFTRLMGVTPRGPEPAEVLIWPGEERQEMNLAEGTEIRSPDASEVRFTLMHDIRVVKPVLKGSATWTGGVKKPLGDGLTEGRDPLDLLPAWGGGPQMLSFELHGSIRKLAGSGPVSLGFVVAGEAGPAAWDRVVIEQFDIRGFWRVLETHDCTSGLRHSGVMLFHPVFPSTDEAHDDMARCFRLRLDQGFRPDKVRIIRIGLNVLRAQEGRDDPGGEIGEGTGLPDQTVEIETSDIVQREEQLVIRTNAGGEEVTWRYCDDLTESDPDDLHYQLTEDGIMFGNGINGKVVPIGAKIRMDPARRTCGADGAVSAGLEWTIAGQKYGTNIEASTPGLNRDGLKELLARAREASRAREGKLSTDALREFLIGAGLGLADVQVTARRRPGLDGYDAPGNRTVLIVPVRDPGLPPLKPQQRHREVVESMLMPLRLLGERLYVSPPIYVYIDMVLGLVAEAEADATDLQAKTESLLFARLWDLPRMFLEPWPDDIAQQSVRPWPAGRDVTVGEIEGLTARLKQVVRVTDCRIARAGQVPGRETIELGDREIALARSVTVEVLREGDVGADVLPVWLDMDLTLVIQPWADKAEAAIAARNALRRWSQAGGVVTQRDIRARVSGLDHVRRVARSAIAFAGGVPGFDPVVLKASEVARAGRVTVKVLYPGDRETS